MQLKTIKIQMGILRECFEELLTSKTTNFIEFTKCPYRLLFAPFYTQNEFKMKKTNEMHHFTILFTSYSYTKHTV